MVDPAVRPPTIPLLASLPDPEDAVLALTVAALRGLRPPLITEETDLQALVADRLAAAGIAYAAEYRLAPRDRIDFLTAGGVGIEVKKGKPNGTRLLAQLERYCRHDAIRSVIVVTPWQRHLALPDAILRKPVRILALNRLWGVAW